MMILDFGSFIINESSLKKLKREVHGALNMSARKRMRKELRNNIITFKFKKRNGDIRTAHGTLHPDYLPPLKGGAPRPEMQMVYYDLDKKGWRSFRSFTFIKILNIKPVTGSPAPSVKPTPKPVSKPKHEPEEEEDVKKTTSAEDIEKEVEKEEHTKEKKEKKKIREIDDEIEDDDDKKSVLDDKDTPEEEEVIKKDKEDEKKEKGEEKEEKEEKDEDKDKDKDEDEKKKTNESVTPDKKYPNVTVLGDGEYNGALWGHCFVYEGQKYYSECGWRNIFPSYCKMVIENGKAWAYQVDEYQRESLKKLYQ